jgi:hypothetical protein
VSSDQTVLHERTAAVPRLRRRRFCGMALLILALVSPAVANINQRTLYEVVFASYLANFTAYVRWPEEAMPAGQPVRFGVFGPENSIAVLREAFATRTVRGRPVVIESNPVGDVLLSCHTVLLDRPTPDAVTAITASVAQRPVLVVSFVPDDSIEGAAIRLLLRGGTVRYRVATDRLTRAGLLPSPELLQLALPPATTDPSRQSRPLG